MLQIEKLNHIEIIREDKVREYRFHSNPVAPKPPIRSHLQHGNKLKNEIEESINSISLQRQKVGVEPDKLMILSLSSISMSPGILDNMLRKFKMSLIEEVPNKDTDITNLLVQFPDEYSISDFNSERDLWTQNNQNVAVLTYAQRRDIFSCIESIRSVKREDRIGPRLGKYLLNNQPLPDGFFIVDIDVWHDGDRSNIISTERKIKTALGTVGSALLGDLFESPSLLLGRIRVNEFSLNAMLDLDIIATIDLPIGTVSEEVCDLLSHDFVPIFQNNLNDDAPLAAVLDSGVFSGHPLLRDLIVSEEDFDLTETTVGDNNGHGTGVAGLVVYGDFLKNIDTKLFTPLVRICNGKIMHNNNGNPVFSEATRPEQIVQDAIEYFHRENGCRIFNLSAGHIDRIYNNGRQMPWAEMLDKLARELDIVIVVSAGNVSWPEIKCENREDFALNACNQLFEKDHRLIDPATASLCITVGAITRFDEPELVENRSLRIAPGPKDSPSVFTRIGKGVNKSIKPELVDYGGNYAAYQLQRGATRWFEKDRNLMEPTLHHMNDKLFKGYCGTSFAAPRVTHLAARLERELETQLGDPPTANLIRALLVNSSTMTGEMREWGEASTDRHDNRGINAKQERCMRLFGYGKANDSILYSGSNQVTLFAEDSLLLRSFHLYKIPVPLEFLHERSNKRIAISLAYNPVTRLSRKDYLANNLWFEVFRKIDEENLARFKARKEAGEEIDIPPVPNKYKASFSPGYTEVDSSTLQNRVWNKNGRGGSDLVWNEDDPYIWILVTGKERFKYSDQEQPQDYAVVITFSYAGEQDIQLYNKIQQRVRVRERQRERARTQVRT